MRNVFKVKISKEIYEKEAVISASRTVFSNAMVEITSPDGPEYILTISPLETCKLENDELEHLIRRRLIDKQIRRDLNAQFGNVRELIVRQAFSPINIIDSNI